MSQSGTDPVGTNASKKSKASKLPQSKFGLGSDHSDMIVFLIKYFRIVSMVFFVWMIGFYQFSIAWILLAVFMYLLREKSTSARSLKEKMIRAMGINEKDAVMARLDEVPSWVFFPDKERAEWLNKIMKQSWPFVRAYLSKMMVDTVEPIINQYTTSYIDRIKFEELDLGDIAPRIGSIKVYTEKIPAGEIIMDIEVLYAGDAQIKMEAKKIVMGIKDIQFQGDVRVVLKPLCNRIPFFATMTMFLLKMPHIDFNLTEVANAFDIPGLRKLIDNTIQDTISKILVLPNRLVIPIIQDFDMSELDTLKSVKPNGVLRVNVIKATNLRNADIGLMGRGKSDPYVKISGIEKPRLTKVIDNNLNPIWNETFDFLIDELNPNPTLMIEVYDKDPINDDFLGGFDLSVDAIRKKGKEEGFYKLKHVKHGELYLKLEWYYLSSNKYKLNEIRRLKLFKMQQATALLLVDLKSASDLPFSQKALGGLSEPNPRATISAGETDSSSSIKYKTTNPVWNEQFHFFIGDPESEKLLCRIEDSKSKTMLGTAEILIGELLNEENLTLDRGFEISSLKNGFDPLLNLKLTLLIFSQNEDTGDENGEPPEAEMPLSKSETEILEQNFTTVKNRINDEKYNTIPKSFSAGVIGALIERMPLTETFNESYGQIKLSFKYQLDDGVFIVTVHECRNLRMVHRVNLPDPYVKIEFSDKRNRKKTKSVKDSLNPVFDERFQWNIPYADVKKKQLIFIVKNDKAFLSRESSFLGQLFVDLFNTELNSEATKWFELKQKHESKFFVEHFD